MAAGFRFPFVFVELRLRKAVADRGGLPVCVHPSAMMFQSVPGTGIFLIPRELSRILFPRDP